MDSEINKNWDVSLQTMIKEALITWSLVECLCLRIADSVREARSTRARDKMIQYDDDDYCYCDDDEKEKSCALLWK